MEAIIKPYLNILHELYIGSHGAATWVIDREPGEGLSETINHLTAMQASIPLVPGGTTIASHTEHLRWSLDYALEFYEGRKPERDWKDSWTVHEVDETAWSQLKEELVAAYERVKQAVSSVKDWSNPQLLAGTLALLPHAAYHLGALKQILSVAKEKEHVSLVGIR